MAIIIFGDTFSFPDGNAATNRVHTYAKGFYENNISVHIICFASDYNTSGDGVINGINFYNPFGQKERNKYFIIRRWQKIIKYFRVISLFRRINDEEKIISINIWTGSLLTDLFGWFLAKIYKTKLIIESSEHPLRHYKKNTLIRITGVLKFYLEAKLHDGAFCISRYLIDFHRNYGVDERKLLLVPSTVDTERFNCHFNPPLPYEYILYCGSLSIPKDGINILINSFIRISAKYPGIKLVLIGKFFSSKDETIITDLVAKSGLSKRIIFLGFLPRTDIPPYLCNAKILSLARPQSMVSDAGFPSKLTEYLAAGRPVVVTNVGEIHVYLKDNYNIFLSQPGSIDAFADKLDYVLSNYDFSEQVGLKGKELTTTIFNYNFQAKRMLEFITSLN